MLLKAKVKKKKTINGVITIKISKFLTSCATDCLSTD